MNYLLETKNLTKSYDDFTLDNVSITVPNGTMVGLVGENGAGKSTLFRIILGLCKADAGTVFVLGKDVTDPDDSWREDIGVVMGNLPFQYVNLADVEKILKGIYKNWDSAVFAQYCKKFDLPAKKKVKDFSLGMQRKLSIAMALSHHPKLLLLDEATSGLDPVVRSELLDELQTFIQDEGHGILLSSHITSDLDKTVDYINYLHKGRVILSGEKDLILS